MGLNDFYPSIHKRDPFSFTVPYLTFLDFLQVWEEFPWSIMETYLILSLGTQAFIFLILSESVISI